MVQKAPDAWKSFLLDSVQFLKEDLNLSNIFIIGLRPEYDIHVVRYLALKHKHMDTYIFKSSLKEHLVVPLYASKVLEKFCKKTNSIFILLFSVYVEIVY